MPDYDSRFRFMCGSSVSIPLLHVIKRLDTMKNWTATKCLLQSGLIVIDCAFLKHNTNTNTMIQYSVSSAIYIRHTAAYTNALYIF